MTALHLFGFFASAVLAFLSVPRLRAVLLRRHLAVPAPRPRDIHTHPIPRLGGLVVAASFWLVVALIGLVKPDALHLSGTTLLGVDQNLIGLFLGSVILVGVGVVDDLSGVTAGWKLVFQVIAAAMLPLFGVRVQWLADPFGGANIELLPYLDALLAIIWVVLVVNVLNFLDGLDGLATGVASIAVAILALLALAPFVAQPALALLLFILLGATLGFLPHNWYPAKIFLGDTGSHFLGYLIAAAAIISGGKLATAALVLSLPILDALWTILRRVRAGRSPFSSDREHLHHRLLFLGLSQPRVVGGFMGISAIFGMIALTSRTAGKVTALSVAVLVMIVILALLAFAERRAKKS